MALFRRAENDHVCLATSHHIIDDLWSLVVIMEEIAVLYPAARDGTPPRLPPPSATYRDFVRWQADLLAGPRGERLWSYWQRQLTGAPVLDLPTDRPRPPRFSHRGATVPCRLGADRTRRLKALAAEERVTLFSVLLAGFQVLLSRYSGQDDVI